jgi:hypothetical protein
MKLLLAAWLCLLLQPNEASVLKNLSYVGSSRPTHLFSNTTGFIATLDHSVVYFSEDSDTLNYRMVDLRQNSLQSGVSARDVSCILYCFLNGECCFVVDAIEVYCVRGTIPNSPVSMCFVDDSFYVASSANSLIRIVQYSFQMKYYLREPATFEGQIINRGFVSREFFFNFYDDDYVYFIGIDTLQASRAPHTVERRIALMRGCRGDNNRALLSMFEVAVDCGSLDLNTSITSFSKSNHTVLLGLVGSGGREKFCVFTTKDVNNIITRTYDLCYQGDYESRLPWARNYLCTHFNEVSWMGMQSK